MGGAFYAELLNQVWKVLSSRCTRRVDHDGKPGRSEQTWITLDQALRVATIDGADCSHEEKTKGSVTAGKLADFVMLATDPHDVDPDEIKNIKVVRTVVGGRIVYPKNEA